eukprot:7325937-Heterocapsa_arctica.AAC.1
MAKRPTDLGTSCTGAPVHGTTRYWRRNQARLPDQQEGRALTAGRKKLRTGGSVQPVDPGRICRLLRGNVGDAGPGQGPANGIHVDARPQEEGLARGPPQRKLVPQEVAPAYDGPRLTGGQELRRLFAAQVRDRPPESQEAFPRLTVASRKNAQEDDFGTQPAAEGGLRPRSRSPRASAWTGAPGRHLEAPKQNTPDLLGFLRRNQLTQAQAKAQPKSQARK